MRRGAMRVSSSEAKEAVVGAVEQELASLRARGVVMAGNAFSPIVLVKGSLNDEERTGAVLLSGADGTALRAALGANLLELGHELPARGVAHAVDDRKVAPLLRLEVALLVGVFGEHDGPLEIARVGGRVRNDRLRLGRSERAGYEIVLHVDDDQVVVGHDGVLSSAAGERPSRRSC